MLRCFSVILIFFSFCAATAQSPYEQAVLVKGKDTLPFKLLKPVLQSPGKKYPLVIFFHGAGERGRDNQIQTNHIDKLFLDSASRADFPCFLVAPQCKPDSKWVNLDWKKTQHIQPKKPSLHMQLVRKLIDSIKMNPAIDTNRIYVTGLSMGGYGTWDYCARYPKEVAAAAPVCGGYDAKLVKKMSAIPFWVFHGDLDKVVPVINSRNMVKGLKKLQANVKYTELPGVKHAAWVDAYKTNELLKWMFSFSKNKS